MATRTSSKKTTARPKNGNGGRATVRDVLNAVDGMNERIDGTNKRIDRVAADVSTAAVNTSAAVSVASTTATAAAQDRVDMEVRLTAIIEGLRKVVNDQLHALEADVKSLKRPWTFVKSGWTKFCSGVFATSSMLYVFARLGLHFPHFPF